VVSVDDVYRALAALPGPTALATVVRAEGSAYRREGAKLLVPADELAASPGMISGGCLEEDVREQARRALAEGRPRLLTYDMRAGDDGLWGLNLGCNGLVELLLEPVDGEFWRAVAREWQAGRPVAAVAVVSDGPLLGRRWLLLTDGSFGGQGPGDSAPGDSALADPALAAARAALEAGRSRRVEQDGLALFIEVILPPPVLWVAGAGPDVPPLVEAAARAGWRVRVVDRRKWYLDPARFPLADGLFAYEPDELAAQVGAGGYALVMHHRFEFDREYLQALLRTPVRYLGVLGPRRRTEQLLEGGPFPACVRSPVGLDLGGEGPAAVALSIVAELQAVRHGRSGAPLSVRKEHA
jgi:xanthine dehydrogenase accessory factor